MVQGRTHQFRAPHQRQPARRGEIGAERHRCAAVAAAGDDHRDADHRAAAGCQQQHQRQHLPAHPGPERGQQLEIAVAHALLAGEQLEGPVHRPQHQVAGDGAYDRRPGVDRNRQRRTRRPGDARQQAEPHQRQRDCIGQQLVVQVDHRKCDKRPGHEQRRDRSPVPAVAPHDRCRQQCRAQLDQRVARRNRHAAVCAAAAQCKPAQHRYVLVRADRRAAVRASRSRVDEVVTLRRDQGRRSHDGRANRGRRGSLGCASHARLRDIEGLCSVRDARPVDGGRRRGGGRFLVGQHLARVCAPAPVQHDRQPVDHHVQEAADQQRKNEGAAREQRPVRGKQLGQFVQTTAPSLKIGRYIATTMPPTSTPRITMMNGSSRLDNASTAASTSAS